MKIRNALIIVVILFFVALTVVFAAFIASNTSVQARNQYKNYIIQFADIQVSNVEQCFDGYDNIINNILTNDTLIGDNGSLPDETEAFSILQSYTSEGTSISSFAIVREGDDNFYIGAGKTDVFNDDSFESIKLLQYEGYYCIKDSGKHYIVTKRALSDEYTLICWFNSIDLDAFVKASSFSANARTILIDHESTVIDLGGTEVLRDTQKPEYKEFKARMAADNPYDSEEEWIDYEIGGKPYMALLKKVGSSGWYAVTIAESDKAFDYSTAVSWDMFNLSWIMILVLIALSILTVFAFFKPLYIIDNTIQNLKRGNLDARVRISSKNEYGEIADGFNRLLDSTILSEARYKTIIEMSDNIIFEWNFNTKKISFSNNFNKKFSYRAPSDYYYDSFLIKGKIHPDDAKRYNSDIEKLAEGQVFNHKEYRFQNMYGDYIWFLMRTAAITDRAGTIAKVVGVLIDIDRAKKSEEILTMQASFDALTKMFNRETVENLINNEIELLSIRKNQFSILFIDIDDFKYFNDNFSHAVGDHVLRFTADTINEIVSGFGIAGRFGGDEFVACVRNSDINAPDKVAQQILDKLKAGIFCDGAGHLVVNVSIGIAVIRDSSQRVDEIIGLADEAMYRIKKSGKSNYGFIN